MIHIEHQFSLRIGETLQAKASFERLARAHGVTIKQYQADNAPFGSEDFLEFGHPTNKYRLLASGHIIKMVWQNGPFKQSLHGPALCSYMPLYIGPKRPI